MRLDEPVRRRTVEHIFDPRRDLAAERAREALDVLLGGVYRSAWPDVAWEFSRLTGDGFPVEAVFSTRDDEIRYTCEVAGPEVPDRDRLSRAEGLLVELGSKAAEPLPMDFLRSVQADGLLTWGAWMGGRHSAAGSSYKLYAECPAGPGADRWIARIAGTAHLLSTRATELRIAAYEPASSRMEFYFRTEGLEPWEVGALLRRFGLGSRQDELLHLASRAWGRPIRERLPAGNAGFSIGAPLAVLGGSQSLPETQAKPVGQAFSLPHSCHGMLERGRIAFSLHFYARSVFGGDGSIRRRLLELAVEMGWNMRAYEVFSEALAHREDARTLHGVISFTVAHGSEPVLQIGLRPPEEIL